MARKKEYTIKNQIKDYCNSEKIYHQITEATGSNAGTPDVVLCFRGRYVAFEIKAEGDRATQLQLRKIETIRKSGGRAFIVRNFDDFFDYMMTIDVNIELEEKALSEHFLQT